MFDLYEAEHGESTIQSIEGRELKKFSKEVADQYTFGSSFGLSVGGDGYGFSTSLSQTISNSVNFKVNKSTTQYYNLAYQLIIDKRRYIKNFDDTVIRDKNILSSLAINKLNSILSITNEREKENAIWEFFNTFGTHIIKDALYGGKIEILFYLITNDENFDYELINSYKNSLNIGGGINGISASAGIATEINSKIKESISSNKTLSKFNAKLVGGNSGVSMKSTSDMSEFYDACDDWIEEYNNRNEKNIMVALSNSTSLCPIWELLPSEYSEVKELMKTVFKTRLIEENNEFTKQFDYNIDVTREFSGGSGTEKDPYLIEAPEQLKLINNYLDQKDIYFKLISNIKIEESWVPIGSNIREENDNFNHYFKGHFDGNGKEISYKIDITRDFNDLDLCYYYGLFGAIQYATIENLTIDANIKTVDYDADNEFVDIPSKYNPEELAAGAIAGFSSDCVINNCKATVAIELLLEGRSSNNKKWVIAGGLIGVAEDDIEINTCITSGIISTFSCASVSGGIIGWTETDDFLGSTSTAILTAKNKFLNIYMVGDTGILYGYLD